MKNRMEKDKTDRRSTCRFLDIFEGKFEESLSSEDIVRESNDAEVPYLKSDSKKGTILRRISISVKEQILTEGVFDWNPDFRSRAFTNPEMRRPAMVRRKGIMEDRDNIDIIVKNNSRQICMKEENGNKENCLSPSSGFRSRASTNPEMRRPNIVSRKPINHGRDKVDIFVQNNSLRPCPTNGKEGIRGMLSNNAGFRTGNTDMTKLAFGSKQRIFENRNKIRIGADYTRKMGILDEQEITEDDMKNENNEFRLRDSTYPESRKNDAEGREPILHRKNDLALEKHSRGIHVFVKKAASDAIFHDNIDSRSRAATNPEMRRPRLVRKQPIIHRRDKMYVNEMIKDLQKGTEKCIVTDIPDLSLPEKPVMKAYGMDTCAGRPRAHTSDVMTDKSAREQGNNRITKNETNETKSSTNNGFGLRADTSSEMRRPSMKLTQSQNLKVQEPHCRKHSGIVAQKM